MQIKASLFFSNANTSMQIIHQQLNRANGNWRQANGTRPELRLLVMTPMMTKRRIYVETPHLFASLTLNSEDIVAKNRL